MVGSSTMRSWLCWWISLWRLNRTTLRFKRSEHFLKVPHKDEKAFVKLRGRLQYYEILGVLYGRKTASSDYPEKVVCRLESIGLHDWWGVVVTTSCSVVRTWWSFVIAWTELSSLGMYERWSRLWFRSSMKRVVRLSPSGMPTYWILGMKFNRDKR